MKSLRNIYSLFTRRRDKYAGTVPQSIGIPRALYYYLHSGLWESYFTTLGFKVVLSAPTNRQTMEQTPYISESEHCLPVKIFDAHIAQLVTQVDMVFVPRILSTLKKHISCPKLGALPDTVRAQFEDGARVLTVDINERKVPLKRSLKQLGKLLNKSPQLVESAINNGMTSMKKNQAAFRHNSSEAGKYILLLGHPYALYSSFIPDPVIQKLEAMKVPFRFVDYSPRVLDEGPLKWDACNIMYSALKDLNPADCAGVIQLSFFNCGCDSISENLFRDILKEKGIPFMMFILDEHTGRAGIETRLEAFMDSIQIFL